MAGSTISSTHNVGMQGVVPPALSTAQPALGKPRYGSFAVPMAGGRYSAVSCQTSERSLKGFYAGNSVTQTLSPCSQGKGMPLGARGEESGHQSMGASFSPAQSLHGSGGTVPRATGIAGCSQNIPVYLEQDDQGKMHGAVGLWVRGQSQGVGSPRGAAGMPSSCGRWALFWGHMAIHSLMWCCCRSPFPARSTLIPAPWHCCADPPALGAARISPSPTGNPPDCVQEDVDYGKAHSRPLGSRAHCRGCQGLEPLPGLAPRLLPVPAAQSYRDTCCFSSNPPNLVSFFPEAREQIFSPTGSSCHIGANLELLLAFSFLGSAFPYQPGCRVSGAELCPGT